MIILMLTIPFFGTMIFWGAAKSLKKFGWTSVSAAGLIILNVTANIIPTTALWGSLPWFVVPMIMALVADGIIHNKIKIGKFKEEIAGALVGAMFLVYSMPLIGMASIPFYAFNEVSGYTILLEFTKGLVISLGCVGVSGAIIGIIATKVVKRRYPSPAESTI